MAVAFGLAVGLIAVAVVGQAAAQEAPAPAGFQLSVNQMKINQKISQAAVRRGNQAISRLDALEPKVTALTEGGGKAGPKGDAGAQGPIGPQGPVGPQGVPGSAAGYALVQGDGDVVEARSKGVSDDKVIKPNPGTGVYCFTGLATAPKAMVAVSFGAVPHLVSVNMPGANGQVDGCGVDEPSVIVFGLDGQKADGPFFVWFEV
jgi:hypothetical protein